MNGDDNRRFSAGNVLPDQVLDFSNVKPSGGGRAAPEGRHLVRLSVRGLEYIGTKGSAGFRLTGTVITEDHRGAQIEDVLWATPAALGRLSELVNRVCGVELDGPTDPARIVQLLDNKIVAVEVAGVTPISTRSGTRDKSVLAGFMPYSKPDSEELRVAGFGPNDDERF